MFAAGRACYPERAAPIARLNTSEVTVMLSAMSRICLCLGSVVASSADVSAQQSNTGPSQRDCFAVFATNASGGSLGSILLDRCTGNSWVLGRATLGNGMTANRWYPISVEKGEAITRTQAP
jgi:hypothetical protein